MRKFIFLMLVCWAGTANAAIVNYELPTYIFDDGGTVSGNFDWDDVALDVVGAAITSTEGTVASGTIFEGGAFMGELPNFNFWEGAVSGYENAPAGILSGSLTNLVITNPTVDFLVDPFGFLSTASVTEFRLRLRPMGMGPVAEDIRYSVPSAVPIPAAAWLFGSSIVALAAIRLRKASK
jgi:hypothetical protein